MSSLFKAWGEKQEGKDRKEIQFFVWRCVFVTTATVTEMNNY